ncbi:MAG: uroporphyrinogen decarboxylase family protein [Candidatus Marinimicrobia bacterium]|nr:uroporphyrinogen decarboxylase family protein [Candidatus Neomarinimicrobiota bacterium]
MTRRERVISALHRQETSRVPIGEIGGGYTESIIKALLGDDHQTGPDSYYHNHVNVRQLLGADIMGARVAGPPVEVVGTHEDWGTEVFKDFWGATHTQPPEATVQLVEPIANTPEELDKWAAPDVSKFDKAPIRRWKTNTDLFVMSTLNAGFDLGYEILGFERFMMWTVQAPDVMLRYYEKLIQTNLELALMSAEAGADAVLIADDLAFNTGTFVDPAYLRKDYFPLLKNMITDIKTTGLPVFFHSDGDLRTIIPDLIDCGIEVLQSCDPNANMDIPSLKQEYGRDLAFMGNIDVDLLANGSVEEVQRTTRDLIRDARAGGGFILSTSNVVASYCKPENVKAMYAIAHEELT